MDYKIGSRWLLLFTLVVLSREAHAQATHFTPVSPTGLPYHIVVQQATLNGRVLASSDEIGVFDGATCVGSARYTGDSL